MDEIINFIITHYRLIIEGFLLLLSVVIFILRKKPVDSIFETLFKACLVGISVAEHSYPSGENGKFSYQKIELALDTAAQYLYKEYPEIDFDQFEKRCRLIIESVLSMPQKHDER